jgi:hypothetical protein
MNSQIAVNAYSGASAAFRSVKSKTFGKIGLSAIAGPGRLLRLRRNPSTNLRDPQLCLEEKPDEFHRIRQAL